MAATLRLARTAFPEREDKNTSAPDQWALGVVTALRRRFAWPPARQVARLAALLREQGPALATLSDDALRLAMTEIAPSAVRELRRRNLERVALIAAEAAHRTLGLRPYPVQLFGATTLLRGRLAEMRTGEGKTLTAGLAAAIAAAGGLPVHVVTVNDYLAQRDADLLRPLFEFLGLSVGVVHQEVPPDARRAAYACDIAYCTNKEMVFDYLRDRVAAGGRASAIQLRARRLFGDTAAPPMLRGLHFAIVDEADSILIDEARTPLILAEKAGTIEYAHAYPVALQVASDMNEVEHYEIDRSRREVRLTAEGRRALATRCSALGSPWSAAHVREHLVVQALRARELFHRDQHYLIDAEGLLQIIDEYTGRVLPGRTWEGGLHQMIETKEGLALSEQTLTLARITYQRFFSRYLRLAGMTGTAREVASEMAAVYRLQTVAVPTHRSDIRSDLPARLCANESSKWKAVADFVEERQRFGQPVLIGTRSVEASERLSRVLNGRGLTHVVLNARQDADEAAVVAAAGQPGTITVATNMAGRGTDIALGEGVAERGGLCVVLTEYHESPRIDRQLVGRCARQGDPGTAVAIVALDDALLREHGGPEAALLRRLHATSPTVASGAALSSARAAAQGRAERMHARTRRDTLRHDRNLDQMMSISGDPV